MSQRLLTHSGQLITHGGQLLYWLPAAPARLTGHGGLTATAQGHWRSGRPTGHGALTAKTMPKIPIHVMAQGHGVLSAVAHATKFVLTGGQCDTTGSGVLHATTVAHVTAAAALHGQGVLSAVAIPVVTFVSKGTTGTNGTSGSSASWSETIATTAKCTIATVGSSFGTTGVTATAKVGATSMTLLGSFGPLTTGSDNLYIWTFGLLSPPTGSQTIAVTFSTASDSYGADSMSYSGVTGFGTAVTGSGTGGTATTTVTTSATGQRIVNTFTNVSSGSFSAYNQTSRYSLAGSVLAYPVIAGDAAGAGSVTFSATQTSGAYSFVSVPLH